MSSFGQLKNSVQRLEQLNRNMGIVGKIKCSKNAITEKEIKNQPISLYLQILHFAFTEYSPQLYKQILEISPNLKTLSDSKFVEACFAVSRNIFNCKPQITIDQFLQEGKLIQKRLKWVVDVVEEVYKLESKLKPKTTKQSKPNQYVKQIPSREDLQENIDDQELQKRQIKIRPTQFSFQSTFASKNKVNKQPKQQSQLPKPNNTKANVFPKNLVQPNYLSSEEQSEDGRQVLPKKKVQQRSSYQKGDLTEKPTYTQARQQPVLNQQDSFVSRQEYNEMLVMISTLNGTINNLVSKFNNFQGFVSTQLSKITARVSLVQENVKIIKANI